MHKLILNELFKIIKKKSFLIITIITLVFSVFCNFVYSSLDSVMTGMDEEAIGITLKESEANLKLYKDKTPENIELYIDEKTIYDKLVMIKEYEKDDWRYNFIAKNSSYDNALRTKNTCSIENLYDKNLCDQNDIVLNKYNELIKENDWKKAAKYELEVTKKSVEETTEGMDKNSEEYLYLYYDVEKIQFRIDHNISYADTKKSIVLEEYFNAKQSLASYKDPDKLNKNDYEEYKELRATYLKDQYILTHNYNTSFGTLASVMENFYSEFSIIILVMILMISGTIMSQEYNKGTIKLLLVKPYSRWKILLSKYLTVLIMIFLSYGMIFLIELLCGGIILGFDTAGQSILQYSSLHDSLIYMNIFEYNFITFIGNLPFFIFLATVAFAISTIFGNTAVAIISGFAVNIAGNIFALLGSKFEWTKYLIFNQCDITKFIVNGTTNLRGDNLFFALGICLIYILAIVIPTFIIFQKKDIKNV